MLRTSIFLSQRLFHSYQYAIDKKKKLNRLIIARGFSFSNTKYTTAANSSATASKRLRQDHVPCGKHRLKYKVDRSYDFSEGLTDLE